VVWRIDHCLRARRRLAWTVVDPVGAGVARKRRQGNSPGQRKLAAAIALMPVTVARATETGSGSLACAETVAMAAETASGGRAVARIQRSR
jgi:hypothetical protein